MIPPIIHHVWAAHDPIPYTFRANMATFEEHNPDWEHRLWTEDDLDGLEMVNRDLYDAAKAEAPNDWIRWRADIARLEIVYQFGGIYADTDAECLAPIDSLRAYPCWFAESPNAHGYATQAVFGAERENAFLWHALAALETSARHNADKRINHRVGSRFIANLIRRYQIPNAVEVLPWRWFAGNSIKGRHATMPVVPRFIDHKYFNSERHAAKAQIAAFRAAAAILSDVGATWWLTSGLLLGHIREGRILPWDLDIDVGIWPEDVDRVSEGFQRAGWLFKRSTPNQMWPVHFSRTQRKSWAPTKIDIHTHHRDGGEVYKLHGKRQNIRMAHPAYLFDDMRPTVFYNVETLIPNPPEEYLAHMYGDDWLTPKQDWQWDKSPMNIERL